MESSRCVRGVGNGLVDHLLTAAVATTGELAVDIAVEMAHCVANLAGITYLSVVVTVLVVVVVPAIAQVASGPEGTLAPTSGAPASTPDTVWHAAGYSMGTVFQVPSATCTSWANVFD